MNKSDKDDDLTISYSQEVTEYEPVFKQTTLESEDIDLSIDFIETPSEYTLIKEKKDCSGDLDIHTPEEKETVTLPTPSAVEKVREPKLLIYNPKELQRKKEKAIFGALLLGTTTGLLWAGLQFAMLGAVPRISVLVVPLLCAAGTGIGDLREHDTRRIAAVCSCLCVLFAYLSWSTFGYLALENLSGNQQHELLSYFGVRGKPETVKHIDFLIHALQPVDFIIFPLASYVGIRANREARW